MPNLTCYVRAFVAGLAVVVAGWSISSSGCPGSSDTGSPYLAAGLYTLAMALDGLDGFAARVLDQASEFGAMLDVVIDNVSRGAMWILALDGPCGVMPIILETLVFAVTHSEGGKAWKTGCFASAPRYVVAIMANGFRTPLGVLTVFGLHFLPMWLYLVRALPANNMLVSVWLGIVLIVGRFLGFLVEIWLLNRHIGAIIQRDCDSLRERRTLKGR